MRLSKQTHQAIQILIHCAHAPGGLVTGPEIARAEGITEHNVAKIVGVLARGGFVTTVRGRTGGLKLARPASKITLGDIVRATETTSATEASSGEAAGARPKKARSASKKAGSQPAKRAAAIAQLFDEALEGFIGILDKHTLADLSEARGAGRKQTAKRRTRTSARAPKSARG